MRAFRRIESDPLGGRARLVRRCIVLLMIAGLVACGDKPSREGEAPAGPGGAEAPQPKPEPARVATPQGDEPAPAPEPTPEPAPAPPTATKLADALLAKMRVWITREHKLDDDLRKRFEIKVGGQKRRWRQLFVSAYVHREYEPFTSTGGRLTKEGRLAADLVLDVGSHGLEESPYPIKALRKAVDLHDSAYESLEALNAPSPDAPELDVLKGIVASFEPKRGESYLDQRERVEAQLLDAGLTDDGDHSNTLAALESWANKAHLAEKDLRTQLGDIDLLVVRGFLQYALDFEFLVVAQPFKALAAENIPQASKKYRKQLLARLKASGDALGSAMRAMWPRHPFYEKARNALARYRELAKPGAVPELKFRGRARRKSKGKKVLAIKARLAAQGYYDGDVDDPVFGPDLVDAVKEFQRHHQLDVDGKVQNGPGLAKLTKKSMQVSMKRRVRSLELSLQRWRESPSHQADQPFYFRVNIPQFEVEVWDEDELVKKHRIVVGNNKMEIDQDHGRKGYLNRTALISDWIERVVINPVWNVPERIRIQEILVEAAKDPDYMEKHGYRVRQLGNGREQIYQEAGPGNALGRVKILFPNEHAIYMHDTPKRRLFKRTIRAFSHGCMRLHEPVGMATFLLERQGLMTSKKVQKILKSKKERGVRLNEKIPIHIEYNTVAFEPGDDEPIFLNDIYKYDRAYWDGDLPLQREEKIPVVKTEIPAPEWGDDPRGEDTDEEAVEGGEAGVPKPKQAQVPDRAAPAVEKPTSDRQPAPRDRGIDAPTKPAVDRKPSELRSPFD